MKLRYFYLLCFLVSIDWSFCYEFISDEKSNHCHWPVKKHFRPKHGSRKKHNRCRRQGYEDEKDPVASIDIASFIQQPDAEYESVNEYDPYGRNQKRNHLSKENDLEFASLSEMQKSLDNLKEKQKMYEDANSNFASKNFLELLSASMKKTDDDNYLDRHSLAGNVHKNNDRIPRRRQAIPFFSHKGKEKKHKRRKFFNFGSKTTKCMTTILPKYKSPLPDTKHSVSRISKRSNVERYCPLCKRKILSNNVRKHNGFSPKNIHNSRQYYQNVHSQNKRKKNVSYNDFIHTNKQRNSNIDMHMKSNRGRKKRAFQDKIEFDTSELLHKTKNFDKERQLKELEVLQKKVDNVKVTYPFKD